MAPHSSTLAWTIPWMEEPGGLQFMGSWRVGHNWATSLWLFTFMHWRRKWQPTPVFLPGESQGRGSLVGSCGEQAPPLAKVMRKEAWHTQRRDQASGVSLEILKQSTHKTRVCLLSALCFHLHLWLYGGLSPTTSLKKVSLQLQLIIPGCDSV